MPTAIPLLLQSKEAASCPCRRYPAPPGIQALEIPKAGMVVGWCIQCIPARIALDYTSLATS